jgi:hypothetical protein
VFFFGAHTLRSKSEEPFQKIKLALDDMEVMRIERKEGERASAAAPLIGGQWFRMVSPRRRPYLRVRGTARADSRRSRAGLAPGPQALPMPAAALILYICIACIDQGEKASYAEPEQKAVPWKPWPPRG